MDIYNHKLTTLIFVSAILLNPVFSSTTAPSVSANSSMTTNSTISETTDGTNITTTPTTTTSTITNLTTTSTTTSPTTVFPTIPPIPVNISENCNDTLQCQAVDKHTECTINGICECMANYFIWNETFCAEVSYLIPSELRLDSNESTVSVAWTGPSGLPPLYHIVYHVNITGDNSDEQKTTTETKTQFEGLTAGKMYNVTVYSKLNMLNESITSDSINGSQFTRPYPPDCPPNRYNYSAPNITVSWMRPMGEVTGYIVKFDNDSLLNVMSLSQMFYSTEPGVNYTMTLQSYVGHNGEQYNSSVITCYIRTESAEPGPPQNVTLSGAPLQKSFNVSIEKTNTPRGDIEAYVFCIYSKNYNEEEFMLFLKNVSRPVTDNDVYSLSQLSAGTFYFIQVFTKNDKFTSESSFNLTGIRTAEGVPGVVSNLTYTSSRTSANVTWMRPQTPRGDIIGYKVQITVASICREYILEISTNKINGSCTPVRSNITKNQKTMNQFIDNLQPSISYDVKVWAYTEVGSGAQETTIVTTNLAPPYKPTIKPPVVSGPKSVIVMWGKPSEKTGPTNYSIYTYDDIKKTKHSNTGCEAIGFDETQCTVTGLQEFWKYSFEVEARVNQWTNKSERSSIVTTQQGVPAKVTDFKVILYDSGCKTHLTWSTPDLLDRNGVIRRYAIEYLGVQLFVLDPDPDPYKEENTVFTKELELDKEKIITITVNAQLNTSTNGPKSVQKVNTVECFQPLSAGEKIGIALCVILLVIAIGLGAFIIYRKWDSIKPYLPFGATDEVFEPLQPEIEIERNRPIVVSSIKDLLTKYHGDDNRLFLAEYEDLKTLSPRHPSNAANEDENKAKNRYTNILPFDHSRVILAPTDDEESSDYINANYIPGYSFGKEYIASQGPLPGTSNDFWRMIWEQHVSVVVMLTKCSENNMDKCEHYWPYQANEPKCYDDLMVNVTSISNMGKYDINIMDLCLGDEKRVIRHFHFLEWPDFSAKVETSTLIDFITTVRLQITPDIKGPIVVHCSAGVGRTGSYITVDYLMQFVRDHDLSSQVDIFDWVLQMRDSRVSMVQTPTQYAFIHDSLADIVERKKKTLKRNSEVINGDIAIDNPAFEPDDLYENTKVGLEQPKTEL